MGAMAFATSAGFSGQLPGHQRLASWSSRCATTPRARSATATTGPRRASGRAAGRRGGGAGGGPPHAGQAGLAQGAHLRGAGDLLARRRPQRARAAGGGDLRRGGLAQEQLPGPARGDAGRLAAGHRRRRSAAAAGARARGRSTARAWPPGATWWSTRGVLRPSSATPIRRASCGRPSTGSAGRGVGGSPHVTTSNFILRAGQDAGRRAGEARARPLRHRADGLRLQRRDRRLLAGRRRLLDREGRARLPGQRGHHLGQLRRPLEGDRRRSATTSTPARRCSARASGWPA